MTPVIMKSVDALEAVLTIPKSTIERYATLSVYQFLVGISALLQIGDNKKMLSHLEPIPELVSRTALAAVDTAKTVAIAKTANLLIGF